MSRLDLCCAYHSVCYLCSMELLEQIVGAGRPGTIAHRVSVGSGGHGAPYHTRSKDAHHVYSNRHHTVPTNTLKYYIQTQRVSAPAAAPCTCSSSNHWIFARSFSPSFSVHTFRVHTECSHLFTPKPGAVIRAVFFFQLSLLETKHLDQ